MNGLAYEIVIQSAWFTGSDWKIWFFIKSSRNSSSDCVYNSHTCSIYIIRVKYERALFSLHILVLDQVSASLFHWDTAVMESSLSLWHRHKLGNFYRQSDSRVSFNECFPTQDIFYDNTTPAYKQIRSRIDTISYVLYVCVHVWIAHYRSAVFKLLWFAFAFGDMTLLLTFPFIVMRVSILCGTRW